VHNLTIAELHTYYVRAGSAPILVHNCGGYFTGHADSCTCEGIGDITYQGIDEAEDVADAADDVADAADNLTSHAIQRLRQRGVSDADAQAVLARESFSYHHDGQHKLGYYDPKSKVFVAKTIDGNVNTVMTGVTKAYVQRLQGG
jgi:cellobiose-specific phosphotransferase system component IIA